MKDMLCSLAVASLASADRPAKFSTATGAFRTTVSAGWRALESVGTFSMAESRCMVVVAEAGGLKKGLRLVLEHDGYSGFIS